MIFRVGMENNNDDRSIAWALDHPGCFAYGQNSDEAQRNFVQAAYEYVAWIARHEEPWLDDKVEVLVEETFEPYFVNSLFERVEPGKTLTWSNPSFSMIGSRLLPTKSNEP